MGGESLGRGGDKVPQLSMLFLTKKSVEQQRANPAVPQRYQSKPSKTQALAGGMFKKIVTKLKDKMPDPLRIRSPHAP